MTTRTLQRPTNHCLDAADDALMAAVACQRRLAKALRESRQTINALAAARDALRNTAPPAHDGTARHDTKAAAPG